ncbi:DoxX family protein [Metabacillus niabensis]|uniref:Membrane protein n=1 Tax=Metabacillus niabensis TaxID=324854 RepID=A0ABT9Z6J1_9BACI|nr:DoxX family protein [Metabacillus niabensis]MDQ0227822.1 putative membrane protein [Metabacillus niabensis]PAD66641.1 hypothetical protein CHH83_23020 [Bacillus sp. 7586-K]
MEPFITLIIVTLGILIAGRFGVKRLQPWTVALRGGVAAMFLLTGVVHFVYMRAELINMVPPSLPNPDLLVTITGLLEIAGAIGLLWKPTVPWASAGLTALLIVMFPANIYLALEGSAIEPFDALIPRTILQLFFLSATITILVTNVYIRAIEKNNQQ